MANNIIRSVLVLLLLACQSLALAESTVGFKTYDFVDPQRENWAGDGPRPLTTAVWYPASSAADTIEIAFPRGQPIFIGGTVAAGAALETDGKKRPLVIMSHGTGGSGLQMMWLGRRLAAAGYIAAAVNHHGNTAAEASYDPRGFRLFWERTTDLSRVIDLLLDHPEIGPGIDSSSIAAVGFSLGGYTVTALAGGRIDLEQFEAYCAGPQHDATCDAQNEYPQAETDFQRLMASDPRVSAALQRHRDSFSDTRIAAVIALAPALGGAFTDESLRAIDIPVLLMTGGGDDIAPARGNGQRLGELIPDAVFERLPDNVGHYAFLNPCTDHGKKYVPLCQDTGGLDRDQHHQKTANRVMAFLEQHLAHD